MRTEARLLLLCLAAFAFAAAVVIPNRAPAAAYRLQVVAAGLLLWLLEVILVLAGTL